MEKKNKNNNTSKGTNAKNAKSKGVMIGLLIAILVLVLGGAGGYLVGYANKQHEVDMAQQKDSKSKEDDKDKDKDSDKDDHKDSAKQEKTTTEPTCNADELSIGTAESSEGGAGTLAYDIVLTNTGGRECQLGGFPGVSLVNDNGNQIGSPADRSTNYEEKALTLAPNGQVKATVFMSNPDNYSNGECKEGATKFRVYPPNDTGYLSVATPVASWCPGFETSPILER